MTKADQLWEQWKANIIARKDATPARLAELLAERDEIRAKLIKLKELPPHTDYTNSESRRRAIAAGQHKRRARERAQAAKVCHERGRSVPYRHDAPPLSSLPSASVAQPGGDRALDQPPGRGGQSSPTCDHRQPLPQHPQRPPDHPLGHRPHGEVSGLGRPSSE